MRRLAKWLAHRSTSMQNVDTPHAGCVGEKSQKLNSTGCAAAVGRVVCSDARDGDAGGTGCAKSELAMRISETPNPLQLLR